MNAVWRLVRTFWPKKKCHHVRTFSKVLKLMALFESSCAKACPLIPESVKVKQIAVCQNAVEKKQTVLSKCVCRHNLCKKIC